MTNEEARRIEKLLYLGDYGFTHPDLKGWTFGSDGGVEAELLQKFPDLDKDVLKTKLKLTILKDTRPTMGEVVNRLNELEGDVWNDHISLISFGPNPWDYDDKFPWVYHHIIVYVVKGGSEAHYLHIDLWNKGEHRGMFLGKGFNNLDKLYESAKRISIMFGNGL